MRTALIALATAAAAADPLILEAEQATLAGPLVQASHAGFTGTGYADYQAATGESITWTATVPGARTLTFRYAHGGTTARTLRLEAGGAVLAAALAFPPTGSWTTWRTVAVTATLPDRKSVV